MIFLTRRSTNPIQLFRISIMERDFVLRNGQTYRRTHSRSYSLCGDHIKPQSVKHAKGMNAHSISDAIISDSLGLNLSISCLCVSLRNAGSPLVGSSLYRVVTRHNARQWPSCKCQIGTNFPNSHVEAMGRLSRARTCV